MANSRKGHNEGSIRKKKNGLWEGRYTVGYSAEGKQTQKSIYGKTRSEVSQKLNEIILSLNNGTYISDNNITLSEWLRLWLKDYASVTIRPSTYSSYVGYIDNHISPEIGGIKLKTLTTEKIQLFFNEKYKKGNLKNGEGLSAKTLKNMYNMFHEAMKQAVTNKLISYNIIEGVVLPKREHKEIQVFTPTEEFVIIKMSCFEDLGLAIVFDFYTGLRIGELCGLKWGDFDFEKRSFKVQRTLQRVQKKKENIQPDSPRTEIVNGELKTKNSYREIPIPNAIFDELLNLKKQQEKEKKLYGELYQDMGYVFSNKCGGFVEPSYLRSVYNRILKKSGIRHLNFHTIRHTFATRAIEAGAPAKVVSEILGHSSIQITMDLYCHPSLDAKRDVIENRSLL